MLCIRRTLAEGKLLEFVTDLGAATADACYGFIAGFGLTMVASRLLEYQLSIRVAGSLYLCYLGLQTFDTLPEEHTSGASGAGLLRAYASTLGLTLTNPATIIAFTAIFASMGLAIIGLGLVTLYSVWRLIG